MTGFYLPEYNFSVRLHQDMWCMFCRQDTDKQAETPEQISAVMSWAKANKDKYHG